MGFGGRLLEGDGPKYINSSDNIIFHKRQNLYGIDFAKAKMKESKSFILCEGYFDVIAFHQAGIENAVAPLGTSFTPEQARLLHRYAEKGIMVFDGDEAGFNATRRAARIMEEEGLKGEVVSLEAGQDPADLLPEGGSQRLQNLLSLPVPTLEFMLKRFFSVFDKNTPLGKERILEEIFPYIRSIISPVKREASLEIIADSISVSVRSINEAFRQSHRRGTSANSTKLEKQTNLTQHHVNPELLLIIALVIHPEYFERLRSQVHVENIQGTQARTLYSLLEEHYRNDNMEFTKILESIEDKFLKDLILKKASSDEYGDDPQEYIFSTLQRVRKDWLREKRKEIELLLRKTERSKDQRALRELLSEKVYIDSRLENL